MAENGIEMVPAELELSRPDDATFSGGRPGYVPPKFPLMDPMPEAWDDTPYKGTPARSPRPMMAMVERTLDAGEVELAARDLDEGMTFATIVQSLAMQSWDARLAAARERLAELRRHEAIHGPGSARKPEHPFARVIADARRTTIPAQGCLAR